MMKPSLAVLSLGALLCGCSTQAPEPPPRPAAPPLAAQVPSTLEKTDSQAESAVPVAAYSYDPVGKRDPFRETIHTPCCVVVTTCQGPLCGYSLEELKLTGVISGLANPVAVIENGQGKAFHLYRGSQIGRNGGVVKQVLRDSIVVAESFGDAGGKTYEQDTVLRMPPDRQGAQGE